MKRGPITIKTSPDSPEIEVSNMTILVFSHGTTYTMGSYSLGGEGYTYVNKEGLLDMVRKDMGRFFKQE